MQTIPFWKMSGSGNDFIVIDNRAKIIPFSGSELTNFVVQVCRHRLSVGSDGFILIEEDTEADFGWQFYNSDGSRADMCGNGARCAARFAYMHQIADEKMTFRTDAGIISAEMNGDRVKVGMTTPTDVVREAIFETSNGSFLYASIHTGVPHVVIPVKNLADTDVDAIGREIRYSEHFAPNGTNVNFITKVEDEISIRTYERGVEGETLACGTGSVAAALLFANAMGLHSPVKVRTQGGLLTIYFDETKNGFSNVYLEGDARVIYMAEMTPDAWIYDDV